MHGEQPHCALIVGKTNSGKTKWILDLLETEYKHRFEAIVIICPTLLKNKTYLSRRWIYMDDQVYLCDLDKERLTLNEAIDLYQQLHDDTRNTDDAIIEYLRSGKPMDGHQHPPPVAAQKSSSKLVPELVYQIVLISNNGLKNDDVIHEHQLLEVSIETTPAPTYHKFLKQKA